MILYRNYYQGAADLRDHESCGTLPEDRYLQLASRIGDLQRQLPAETESLRRSSQLDHRENIYVTFDSPERSVDMYGTRETDFESPFREIRSLVHGYAREFCRVELFGGS